MPFCFQVQFQTLWDDWPLWNCSFLAFRLVDDLVKLRDDRQPFFLVHRKLVFRYTINGVYLLAPKNCKLPYIKEFLPHTKDYLSVKYCSYFLGQVVLSCSICGMRLQGNRFSGRVPKSVGGPQRSNNPTMHPEVKHSQVWEMWKHLTWVGFITLESSVPQQKTVRYSDLRATCCLDFDWHQNWRSFRVRLWNAPRNIKLWRSKSDVDGFQQKYMYIFAHGTWLESLFAPWP